MLSNTYPAVEGAIASIRHDLATIAAYLGADEALVADVRLASSEAATSVVEDVFENRGGRIRVQVTPLEDALAVVVSDDGNRALQPRQRAGSRLGLLVMRECADGVSIERTASGGSTSGCASTATASTPARAILRRCRRIRQPSLEVRRAAPGTPGYAAVWGA